MARRFSPVRVLFAFALLLFSLTASDARGQLPPREPTAPPANAGSVQAQKPPLLAQADALLREMSRITGLPIKAPLQKQMIRREEVGKYVVENLHAEFSPEEVHVQEAVLQAFGLVPRDFNLEKFLVSFYTEQAAGFYDFRRRKLFIADWPGEAMQEMVLAHELTHALQDQNFNLLNFVRAVRSDDDASGAREAVVEGYAMAAMMQHIIPQVELASLPSLEPLMAGMLHQQVEDQPAFSNAPFFFRMQTLFPYAQGMGFIERGLQLGGWKKLNQLFEKPPATTKEIFEPAIYFEEKPLPSISLPRPAALENVAGLHRLTENTAGELGYYSLIGQFISEEEAKKVSPGWLADRYIVYEGAKHYVLVARTRWSSSETALTFFKDYQTILAKKFPDLNADKRSTGDLFMGSTTSGAVVLLHKGEECLWAEGLAPSQTEALLNFLQSLP